MISQETIKETHVCVSGASGYIASHLVKQLLEKGYFVHGTARNLTDEKKVNFLNELKDKYPKNLFLYEADLLKDGSFDECVAKSSYIFHTASPFLLPKDIKDPQKDLIETALKGTENILNSVIKYKETVKRVILTSSIAAIVNPLNVKSGTTITEEFWNDTSKMDEPSGAYRISKTKAEQYAWEICQKNNIELVTINPVLVVGEILNSQVSIESLNTSCVMVRNLLDGTMKSVNKMSLGYVDVKDVALAHILGMEKQNAKGNRYIVSAERMNWVELTQFLIEKYPKFKIDVTYDTKTEFPEYEISNSKSIKELGMNYRKKEEYIDELIQSLIKFNHLK